VVTIPETSSRSTAQRTANKQTSSTSSILNILQGTSSKSELSDEALRQLSWASGGSLRKQPTSSGAGWGLSYFSRFFDVTTNDVLQRIIWSVIPLRKKGLDIDMINEGDLIAPLSGPDGQVPESSGDLSGSRSYAYVERFIQSRPDLYGPFWISTTLVFTVALFSNIVSFTKYNSHSDQISVGDNQTAAIAHSGGDAKDQILKDLDNWNYSLDEVNSMSSLILTYNLLWPIVLSFLFWFRGCSKYYTLIETICALGYSISIYVPLSALLMVQFLPFRYIVSLSASLLSGLVLVLSFLPVAKSDPNPPGSHVILGLILIFHIITGYVIHRIMLQ